MGEPSLRVGVVGCGAISAVYLPRLAELDGVEVVACGDLVVERAEARAREFGIGWAGPADEVVCRDDVDAVLNLTIPAAHASVACAAVEAGKHVYNEKPLTLDLDAGRALLATASAAGVLVGAAPDTFLGAGIQTCRALIDEGAIGSLVGAAGAMLCPGHESWHPDPAFYYKAGGGPLLDMGPYYLTALICLLGPARRVTGFGRVTRSERVVSSAPRRGEVISVEVPTHLSTLVEFSSGTIASLATSFDVQATQQPRLEVYGTEGTLQVPDPNTFGGPVLLRRAGSASWDEVPLRFGFAAQSRGIGLADLADAVVSGRSPRASGALALHVLEIMLGSSEASATGRTVELTTTCDRPAPMPAA